MFAWIGLSQIRCNFMCSYSESRWLSLDNFWCPRYILDKISENISCSVFTIPLFINARTRKWVLRATWACERLEEGCRAGENRRGDSPSVEQFWEDSMKEVAFELSLEKFMLANFKSALGTKNTQCQQEQALKLNLSYTSLCLWQHPMIFHLFPPRFPNPNSTYYQFSLLRPVPIIYITFCDKDQLFI